MCPSYSAIAPLPFPDFFDHQMQGEIVFRPTSSSIVSAEFQPMTAVSRAALPAVYQLGLGIPSLYRFSHCT